MRPHTRTQCQEVGNQCPECIEHPQPQNSSNHNSTNLQSNFSSISGTNNTGAAGSSSSLSSYISGAGSSTQTARLSVGDSGASTSSFGTSSLDDPFVAPKGTVSRRSATSGSGIFSMSGSSMFAYTSHQSKSSQSQGSSLCLANGDARAMLIVELPAEILFKILNYMSFKEISYLRMVSRRFNEICASMLNSTFQRFQSQMLSRFQEIKTQMPRRESARRNHPLAQECDVVETLHMRLSLLEMTFGKHIDRKHVCFFAGEILDEVQRIMRYIRHTPNQTRNPKNPYIYMEDELFDLSTMAMEYFKEHIEPTLPEITYFGADFLDFTSFGSSTPPKRRSISGSTTNFAGLESPCSSRASVAGSSVSEAWSSASTSATADSYRAMDMEAGPSQQPPQSNMVLRKRIRRIRQGMKRYNEQLIEYKKELKTCKTKLETQSKQVHEYSQRTEQYDQKFEEVSRKFQTLLTELNKCKIELQYWRSKSTTLLALPSTCASCSAPLELPSQSPENVEAEIKALANQGIFLTEDLTGTQDLTSSLSISEANTVSDSNSILDVQKQPQLQPDLIEEPQPEETLLSIEQDSNPPSPKTRGQPQTCKSGPPSPVSAVGRKRKSRDDLGTVSAAGDLAALVAGDLNDLESKRKSSLRGGNTTVASGSGSGSGSTGSTSATVKNTRIKRPKMSTAS